MDEAITQHETALATRPVHYTRDLFGTPIENQQTIDFDAVATRQSLLEGLERFLKSHSSGEDLGLRTRGKQLAAGVRFMRMVKVGSYDLVIANPPYQGTGKLATSQYIDVHYTLGKADLYAAFLLRGLQLVREGGSSAMLTMRNWMFIKQFSELREHLLTTYGLRAIGDFDRGAFEDVPDEVVSVAICIFDKAYYLGKSSGLCPTPRDDRTRDNERTQRKRSATLCHVGRHDFDPSALKVVPEWPLVYWWDDEVLLYFKSIPLFGTVAPARKGMSTGDNDRFLRKPWETEGRNIVWVPLIKGAEGKQWLEPYCETVRWDCHGLEIKNYAGSIIRNPQFYFKQGVAFSMIGSRFTARAHRVPSIFEGKGSSVFPLDVGITTCAMNSTKAREVLQSLNPGIGFEVGDVNRLPMFPIANAIEIFKQVEFRFGIHESHREPSVEFKRPGPSPWRHVQEWAQLAVDRAEGESLPAYVEELDSEPPTDHMSDALSVALGRFGRYGEGILDPTSADLSHSLASGLLFLDGSLSNFDLSDSLGNAASQRLIEKWFVFGPCIAPQMSLRDWLREKFFSDVHKPMYENRPIHWPLSSSRKTFVAWINIHRWNANTLRSLLADHLQDNTLPRIDGELEDLRKARAEGAKGSDARFLQVQKWKEELDEFIAMVKECAEKRPPPTDDKCPKREVDVRYDPNLDDGVMINSAALWPLLEPQWKDPKKWWKELAIASSKGNKDYDWSHLAMRYFPKRVDDKCHDDPSLGVAHGCFWKYHPAKAWAWELRLQDEISPDFRIEEAPMLNLNLTPSLNPSSQPSDATTKIDQADDQADESKIKMKIKSKSLGDKEHRAAYLRDHALEAIAAIEKEVLRRRKDASGKIIRAMTILESGLWSAEPDACWEMETRIIKKQNAEFRLVAPDETESRNELLKRKPQLKNAREKLVDPGTKYPLLDALSS